MLTAAPYIVAFGVALVGFVVLWSNPQRRVNIALFSLSLHVAAWLLCRTTAMVAENGLIWLRITMAVGAMLTVQLAFLFEAIVRPNASIRSVLRALSWWFLVCGMLAAIAFTDWFIPSYSTSERQVFGHGYYVHIVGTFVCQAILLGRALLALRTCQGIQRVELSVALLGGCCTGVVVVALMLLQRLASINVPPQLPVLLVLAQLAAIIGAITTYRIFEARHLFLLFARSVVLLLGVAVVAWSTFQLFGQLLPDHLAVLFATAAGLIASTIFNEHLDRLLANRLPALQARQEAFELARLNLTVAELEERYGKLLAAWGNAERVLILPMIDGRFQGCDQVIDPEDLAIKTLRELKWATPERLERERSTFGRVALSELLAQHRLGVLVYFGGATLDIIVGISQRSSRRPFTYPQVQQLSEVARIMETAFGRTVLLGKAQRAEQLAIVGLLGAGVAHEIRNPLVSIKTFVQLLPHHHHDPAFREKFFRLIGDEVDRIDRLTEQLMDLAAPRNYQPCAHSLHEIIEASVPLITARAVEGKVRVERQLLAEPDLVWTDNDAAKQVLLNLCFNAIQAQDQTDPECRCLSIATQKLNHGVELCISDHGPGISEEIRPHLFQAFRSSKSSGFGLGLAICSDILSSLGARITADPARPGEGATFRVIFPCPPPSS